MSVLLIPGAVSEKTFSALRASVWSRNKGGRVPRAPPLDSPLIFTEKESVRNLYDFFLPQILMSVLPKPIRVTKMLTAQTLTVLLAVHARRDLLETAKLVKVSFFNFSVFNLYSKI